MSRPIRQSTQQVIRIGPVVSTTDYSPKSDLAYNAAGIHASITKAGATAHTNITLANSAGDGYFVADVEGYYFLTLSTTDVDTAGEATVNLTATGYTMPPQHFTVMSQNAYDSIVAGTDLLDANVAQWLGATAPGSAGTLPEVTPTTASKTGYALTSAYDRAKTAATSAEVQPNITVNPTTLDTAERAAIASATNSALADDFKAITDQTDQLTFTTPGKVDASATVDTSGIAADVVDGILADGSLALEATSQDILADTDAIAAAVVEPSEGLVVTQRTEGTDGEPLGVVMPFGQITAWLGDIAYYRFDANADGEFSYTLPYDSIWTLVAKRTGYVDAVAYVDTGAPPA